MAELRKVSNEYREMALEIVNNVPELADIRTSHDTTIVFLSSDYVKKSQGKLVFGLTEVVPSKNKWAIDADFTITIYEENIKDFTEEQKRILLEHELLHIGIGKDGKKYVKPHDLEDFRSIIDKYGAYWDEVD